MVDTLFLIIGGVSAVILGLVTVCFIWWLGVRAFRAAVRLFVTIFIVLALMSIYAHAEDGDRKKARTIEELALVGAHIFDATATEIWLAHDPWIDEEGREHFPTDRNVVYRALDSPAERIAFRAASVAFTLWIARKIENRYGPTPARIIRYVHIGTMTGGGAWDVSLIVRY